MRIELDGGSVKRLVSVWRDSKPVRGEKSPARVAVDSYGKMTASPVASVPIVSAARFQQYLVDDGPDGDRLLDVLQQGPVKVRPRGDAWIVDLDRIERL